MYLSFDARERAEILREYHSIYARWQSLDYAVALDRADPSETGTYEALSLDLTGCINRYRDHVPLVALSRCPFSGEVVYHSLDHFGLDGLWWRYHVPIRPLEMLPGTFVGLQGAVAIQRAPESIPFEVRPGPNAPFLNPRVMADPCVKAVISSVSIGGNVGYPICYFTAAQGQAFPRCNTWGTDRWTVLSNDGVLQWDAVEDDESTFIFDLEPWIRDERVLWISRDDTTLTLRRGAEGCPYLVLPRTANRFQTAHLTGGI